MDIWEWVHAAIRELRSSGHERLAELVDGVSSACCAGQHDRVENMVPEAIALARAVKNPWLELFMRHWLLQSRVLHRHDVSRDTMKEAVSLLEFASRPGTRDCPQAICAVQDLASAYGLVDGVGYGAERLSVTDEALARIDPSWPCFDCVSSEKANALLDLRRPAEALDFCERQLAKGPVSDNGLMGNRFRALCALGRYAEAAQVAAKIDVMHAGESGSVRKALYEALALAKLGRCDEAREKMPALSQLEPEHYVEFLRCARALGVGEHNPNSWRIERTIAEMARTLTRYESHFTLARVHKIAAELALQRGARLATQRQLDAARGQAAHLRDSRWLEQALVPLSAALERLPHASRVGTADELFAALGEDPERDLEMLHDAPFSEARFERARSRALYALGWSREAREVLEAAVERWPEDSSLLLELLEALRAQGEHERVATLCESVDAAVLPMSRLILARSLRDRGELSRARVACREALSADPDRDDARALLAILSRDAGEFDAALEQLEVLVGRHEPGNFDWDRMLVATLAERWDAVRHSAKRLGLPVDEATAGPIDDVWGPCRIRLRLADGSERAYFAWRTGPVTARIDHVMHPEHEQHHGDVVAFDASPLNREEIEAARAAADTDEEAALPLHEYAAYRCLCAGGYRAFDVDGLAPSDEAFAALKARLEAAGIAWEQRSDERYELELDGERRRGTYAFLGVPPTCSDEHAHRVLKTACDELALSLTWRALAAAAGDDDALEAQQRFAEAWRLD